MAVARSGDRRRRDPVGLEHLHDAFERDVVGVVQFVADVVIAGLYAEFAGADPQR